MAFKGERRGSLVIAGAKSLFAARTLRRRVVLYASLAPRRIPGRHLGGPAVVRASTLRALVGERRYSPIRTLVRMVLVNAFNSRVVTKAGPRNTRRDRPPPHSRRQESSVEIAVGQRNLTRHRFTVVLFSGDGDLTRQMGACGAGEGMGARVALCVDLKTSRRLIAAECGGRRTSSRTGDTAPELSAARPGSRPAVSRTRAAEADDEGSSD